MKLKTIHLATAGMIAALYTALTLLLAPISYGAVQVRAAEALTLLPVYSPIAIWGVGVGCLISNAVGLALGTNLLGAMDILFGTAATVLAGLLSYRLRGVRVKGLPILAALPPIVLNALIIGGELYVVLTPQGGIAAFLIHALWVGLGEAAACLGLGLPLCWALQRTGLAHKLFQ